MLDNPHYLYSSYLCTNISMYKQGFLNLITFVCALCVSLYVYQRIILQRHHTKLTCRIAITQSNFLVVYYLIAEGNVS